MTDEFEVKPPTLTVNERDGLWFVEVKPYAAPDVTVDGEWRGAVDMPGRVLAVQTNLERGLRIAKTCAAARAVRTDNYTEHLYWETVLLALARYDGDQK